MKTNQHCAIRRNHPWEALRPAVSCLLLWTLLEYALAAQAPKLTIFRSSTDSPGTGVAARILWLRGEPNRNYLLQATANFKDWQTIATQRTDSNGLLQVTDLASDYSHRFYRAILAETVRAAGPDYRPDRILVKPKTGILLSVPNLLLGATVLSTYPALGDLQVVQLPVGQSVPDAIATLQQSGNVAYAEPDYLLHILAEPNDFRFQDGSLWGLKNTGQYDGVPGADIHAPAGWDITSNASSVIVAVIDTGVRLTHEDLAPNLWSNPGEIPGNGVDDDGNGFVDDVHGINAIAHSGDPTDDHGHGSHVSGTIGARGNNQVGVVGVCWRVQLMACKFLDAHGDGAVADAIACIDYAVAKGAKVINASWGTTGFNSAALRDAIAGAGQAGVIFVAACGNSAEDNNVHPIYPASFGLDNIVSVAATTRTDDLAFFSNYGATTVHLAAPGSPIFSCWGSADNAYQYYDGTSMAAAHVSGAAALCRARFPNETYRQIINRLLAGTDSLPSLSGKCTTGGRLNLPKALGATSPPPAKPAITVVTTDANAAESDNPGTFTISRNGSTAETLTVNYTLGGTADNGSDYQSLAGSATIAAGYSSVAITVTPIDDSEVESAETVVLTLTANAAYDLGSPNSATLTIADNDQAVVAKPAVTVVATDANAAEPNDAGTFTISRTGNTVASLIVNYTLGGTANNGGDYQTLSGSATIAAGNSSVPVTVTPIDDASVEGAETVVLTLAADAAYDLGSPNSANMTIADNDQASGGKPTVTVVATDANASESGDTGTLTISRTGNTAASLTVRYTLGGNAQNGLDYQLLNGSVSIPAGAASASVAIRPVNDLLVEIDEPVYLMISADAAYVVGTPDGAGRSATVTIADNDQPAAKPTVTVVATDANASESGDTGTFTLSRTGSTAASLTVRYTLGGNAQNGVDYQLLGGVAIIPAGAASASVVVRPIDDTADEINEPVYLMISADAAYIVGTPDGAGRSATITLADNDQPIVKPIVTVVATDPTASESGATGTFTLSRTGNTAAALTVRYTLGGNAQNGVDYQWLSGSVNIPAGTASASVVIRPINDLFKEINEPVYLMISADAAYLVGTPDGAGRSATVTILDND